jgi:hypothetical protein
MQVIIARQRAGEQVRLTQNLEAIADARAIAKHKDEFENMGKLKIEKSIQNKGSGFACKMRKDDDNPFIYERKEMKLYSRDDDIKALYQSFLINAKLIF